MRTVPSQDDRGKGGRSAVSSNFVLGVRSRYHPALFLCSGRRFASCDWRARVPGPRWAVLADRPASPSDLASQGLFLPGLELISLPPRLTHMASGRWGGLRVWALPSWAWPPLGEGELGALRPPGGGSGLRGRDRSGSSWASSFTSLAPRADEGGCSLRLLWGSGPSPSSEHPALLA